MTSPRTRQEARTLPELKQFLEAVGPTTTIAARRIWNGLAALHVSAAVDQLTLPSLPWHLVLVNIGRPFKLEERLDGRIYRTSGASGDVAVVPAGLQLSVRTRVNQVQHIETLLLLLEPRLVNDIAATGGFNPDPSGLELRSVCGARRPSLEQIGRSLAHELRSDPPLSGLYGESLANALAIHLLREQSSLSSFSAAVLRSEIGLTSGEVRRVREFVEANLQRDVTLSDMAAELHFSTFHFARLFKVAMGVSPHVYLVQRRTERARHLLERTDLPLHEVAARTGFADQSHLARHTRRWLGVRPRDLRFGMRVASAIRPPDMQAAAN